MRSSSLLPASVVAFTALATLGCTGSVAEPSYPSAPSGGYSTSVGSAISSGESAPAPVSGRTSPSDFLVRPDTIEIAFVLTERGDSPDKILADLKTQTAAISQRLTEATGAPVVTRMCGASTSAVSGGGKAAIEGPPTFVVRVDGAIDIALPPQQDYWARSQSIASLVKATLELHASSKPGEKAAEETVEKALTMGFSEPRPLVKEVDKYRAKLLERWTQRARELATAAQSDKAPLAIVDCTPPGDIEQRVISLEEVSLSLPVSCKLSTVRPAP